MSSNHFHDSYGPVALVTGASSGIGRSFAQTLAARGLDLVLVARREQRLLDLARQLERQHEIRVTVCALDLAQGDAATQIAAATVDHDVGLVVSNAGFGMKGDHAANDARAMTDMLTVNCHTPMQLAHAFIPRLRRRGRGGIIFISSVEGLIGCPYSTAYAASKAFVNGLGEGLWGELTPDGIDVLTVCPGATDTEAPGLQGIDPRTLRNVMSPDDVAALSLDALKKGPVFVCSDHYRALFEQLRALPRRDALTAMASSMKK